MKALQTAIWNLYKADTDDDFYTGLSGRFYFHEAKQADTFPFAVYTFIPDDTVDYYFGADEEIEEITMQISIFSKSESTSEIGNLYEYCKTMFDDAILTVTGYSNILCERIASNIVGYRDREGVKIWQRNVDYMIYLEKS